MPSKTTSLPQDANFPWCQPESVKATYEKLHQKLPFKLGKLGRPVTARSVENSVVADGYKRMRRAKEELRLRPKECLLCLTIAPHGDDLGKTIAEAQQLLKKFFKRRRPILARLSVPEPRPHGTAHYNVILKLRCEAVAGVTKTLNTLYKDKRDIFELWEDHDTGESTYSYDQQCIDDRIPGLIPGPIWYALKTTITRVGESGLESHNIIEELRRSETLEEHAPAIVALAWRQHAGLRITRSRMRLRSPASKPDSVIYNIPLITPRPPRHLLPFVKGYRPVYAVTVRREKLLGSRGR
jgi:hypothetical protein